MNFNRTNTVRPRGVGTLRATVRTCGAALLGIGLLAACTDGPETPPVTLGSFSGSVSYAAPETSRFDRATPAARVVPESFVPGEVIVKFRPGLRAQGVTTLAAGGLTFQRVRDLGPNETTLFRAPADVDGTRAAVRALAARPDVEYAHPNYRQQAFATPNDPGFAEQWHLRAINLPAAWDTEKGLTGAPVTVAVLDTGVLTNHPDLAGKLLPGYDFITQPENANDGGGRDADPSDPGDTPGGQSSYHGSHVAGTVVSATNNGVGIAGVSWGAKLLPVRVLGTQGGSLADIVDAMLWSAGLPVPGVPNNPNPAKVINMSLGGSVPCSEAKIYQDTINRVNATGAVVVVAAGNENADSAGVVPASCSGVISVGATGPTGERASYSNWGTRVDVMAPGGDISDSPEQGVLSLTRDDRDGELTYAWDNGTSMASPHVAGVVALMLARDPSLTRSRVLDLLQRTATPLSSVACTGAGPAMTAADCGAGLVDAARVIAQLSGTTTPAPDYSVGVTPNALSLAVGTTERVTVNITPTGGFSARPDVRVVGSPEGVTTTVSAGASANSRTVEVKVAPNTRPGSYALTVEATSGATVRRAALSLTVTSAATPRQSVMGAVVIACFYDEATGECNEQRTVRVPITTDADSATFRIAGLPTNAGYLLAAAKDMNGNGKLDEGDYLGLYLEDGDWPLLNPTRAGIAMKLELLLGTASASGRRGAAIRALDEALRQDR